MKNKRELFVHLFTRFVITILIAFTTTYFAFILIRDILVRFEWSGTETLYPLVNGFLNNIMLILIIVCVLEFIGILFYYFWTKPLKYLEAIIEATETIYFSQDDNIELPNELGSVEQRLNQLRTDLIENQRIAKEAEQRKNDLIVYLAHDLKTPLTSVIGYLNLLRDEDALSQSLRSKYIGICLEKSEQLETLINEFFEITRFNLSTLTLDLDKINLTRMLEQMVFEFEPLLSLKNLAIDLTVEPSTEIRFDVAKMERVFDNLLKNAINYSYPGETIHVEANKTETGWEIHFINRGSTIPEKELEKIFEQFYRLDAARSTSTGGSGLGLAITKKIVELHGGTIRAHSHNEIIAFTISIPFL